MRRRQGGMTIFGGLILFLIIAAMTLVVVRIAPAYIENYTVKRVLGDLLEEDSMAHKPPQEVASNVRNRLKVSGIHDLKGKNIKVKRAGGVTSVRIEYVVRKPIVGNIDALLTFSDGVELVSR
jgi:hypothetical protein